MTAEVEVTLADRAAAAGYYYSSGGSPKVAREIREGKKDEWFRVQAFVRHRIASTTPKDEAIDELVAGIIKLQGAITDLINDSEGVYGLHLNGDPAPWVELTLGGRFEEWIGLPLDEADALIAKHGKVKP